MKHILTSILATLFAVLSNNAAAQSICLGQDTTVCSGSSVTITNCSGSTGSGPQGLVLANPTSVTLSDDSWSPAVNIGFPFNFYGVSYNQCVIGSNGLVSFDLTEANGYCSWALGGAGTMPNPGFDDALNSVMLAYQDINPNPGTSPNGAIQYETIGTAPNRMFVVLYSNINFFSCTSVCNYMALILYETSNNIEVHIGDKPLCASWNGGLAIQGTQNAPGTIAHITPGRNNTQWAANQEGRRWTPTSPTNTNAYAISLVPYALVTSSNTNFQWEDSEGGTYAYNNGTLTTVPNPTAPSDSIGYFLSGSACGASLGGISDTTWVTVTSSSVTASGTDDICSSSQGSVTATPTSGTAPYTYNWPSLGAATQTVNNIPSGTYAVDMTDANGCVSSASVTIGDIPANYDGDSTEVSCPGGTDGTAFAEMIPVIGNLTYQWDDPAMQTTQTAVGLAAGTYNCVITSDVGCSQTVTVVVTEIPGMIGNIVNQTDVTCNSGNDGMIEVNVTQGTAPYTYSWDNSTSTSNIATDLVVGNHTVTVTDANGCVITITGTLGEPAPLDITYLTPDTQICPEAEITLDVTGTGGSSPYTFTWTENGSPIGTGTSITVDPVDSGTVYCVTLSELCGSPTDQECMVVTFPTPIQPNAIADEYEKCMPGRFEFFNTSTNSDEIATMLFEFGDDEMWLEQGADSTHYEYGAVGVYDLTLTATSIYGCVYVDTLYDFLEVKPNPVADFTFSDNPATIFETTIIAQDRSTPDVIEWSWYSPNSNPTNSAYTKPTFVFPQEVGSYPVTLAVTTEHGCVDTTTFYLHIIQDILFFAPNSFTPDGDEHNQTWKVEVLGIDIYDFELSIFNRWGEVVWENHDPSVGWDGTFNGKPVQGGQYVWRARVKDLYNDSKEEFSGTINVLK